MRNDETLRNWLVISACMHIAALGLLYFGMPSLFKPLPAPPMRVIPINIVDIGEITNTRLPNQAELAAKAVPPAPKPEEKPAPPEPKPKPEVKPEPKPEPPKPQEKPKEEPDEAALPKPQAKPKPPEPPKPQQQQPDQLASILKNLTKAKPQPSKVDQIKQLLNQEGKTEGTAADGAQKGGVGPSLSDRLTISAEDALRRQISSCWNIPAGARNAQDLIVEVLIDVNPDRTVRAAQIVDQSRAASDPYFRAAAEAALRALRSPKCTPLELPPDQYEQWKTIRFTFDPRDML